MEFLTAYIAPIIFIAMVGFLLFGYPVAFALAANGVFFGLVGIELGLLQPSLFGAMPERSSTSPMKVKKGMASSVSLAMMPNMRSGRAWNSAGWSRPSSMPSRPKTMPLAASAKATG